MKYAVCPVSEHPTVAFAVSELVRYLEAASGDPIEAVAMTTREHVDFFVGLASDIGVKPPDDLGDDDWYTIFGDREIGYTIAGANPRSVLFAVYRYLQEMGVRWLRPGERGELIPSVDDPLLAKLEVAARPSYRYRSICIEGSTSREHVLDLIDWMAKQGMNGYFIQFHFGTTFFKRWYDHPDSPVMKPEPFTQADLEAAVADIIGAIERRGMSFERMGHGWTCAAVGVSGEGGWDQQPDVEIPEDKRDWLALLKGERKPFGGVMLNTNLNYSRADVRSAVVDAIVDYAREYPSVNLLHFWLADGSNNHDESPESRTSRPSDFYVDMLNELDDKLTAAGLATRIVFLIYVDLLWPPTRATIRHPERFTLMFAPITRTYLQSFVDAADQGGGSEAMTEFHLNQLTMPKSAAANLAYLRAWQAQFPGDGFDFDYHAIWACYFDPNMMTMARTLHGDIQSLGDIGLAGLNSCQNQRMSFPHNLLMDVLARTLWDKSLSFEAIRDASFTDAFGSDGVALALLLEELSELWKPFFEAVYLPEPNRPRIAAGLANMPRLREVADELKALVSRHAAGEHPEAIRWSWRYMTYHGQLLDHLLPLFEGYMSGDPTTLEKFDQTFDFLWGIEPEVHPALDAFSMIKVMGWRVHEFRQQYGLLEDGAAKTAGGAETQ